MERKTKSSIRLLIFSVSLFNEKQIAHCIQLFRERLSGKKSIKVHATRPKGGLGIHLNFAYWPRENLQVCIFACRKFVFPLRGLHL